MQLHISPSLRHLTVSPAKGVREFIKVKIASRRLSYRMLLYSLLFLTFLLRFVFVLTAVDTIDGETNCSTITGTSHASISHKHTFSSTSLKINDIMQVFFLFLKLRNLVTDMIISTFWFMAGCKGKTLGPRILGRKLESNVTS